MSSNRNRNKALIELELSTRPLIFVTKMMKRSLDEMEQDSDNKESSSAADPMVSRRHVRCTHVLLGDIYGI